MSKFEKMKIKYFTFLFWIAAFLLANQIYTQNVISSFSSDVSSGCSPLVVNFNNTSSNTTNATQYKWDFGNGSSSVLENPSSTFTQPGFYEITLISTNPFSSDTLISTNYIEVYDLPTSDFTYNSNTDFCSSTNQLSFVNSSLDASSYIWDFGINMYFNGVVY